MTQRHRILVGIALVVLLHAPRAHAQLAVLDAANLAQNIITAIQTVLIVANQVLELTGVGRLVLDGGFDGDMGELGAIIEQAEGLSYDVGQLQSQITTLFSLSSAPRGSRELSDRLAEIRLVVWQSYSYAMRTQTLLATTLRTIERLTALVATISDYLGNMQANQTMSQFNATVTEQLSKLQVQTAAFERAQSVEKITVPLVLESLDRIHEQIMSDHPE